MKPLKLFFLAVVCLVAMTATAQNQQPQSKAQMNAQKFATTLYLIENYYVDTANSDKIVEDAIVAALKELDPHSAYISKKDVEKTNEPLVGSFEGIGVTFQLIRDTITVISPTAGGPSEKVGIMAGDQFIKIDGEDAFGKKVDNEYVQKHLRGKKGTKVTVSVKRGNDPELIDFEIIRDKIPLNSINAAYMLDNHVGYIKLDRFAQESTKEFKEAFAKLQDQGMESLIFDLRGNTGGYLNTSIELVDQFLTENKLIVLDGTREDLAGRGGTFVDEDDKFPGGVKPCSIASPFLAWRAEAFGEDDEFVFGEELVDEFDGGVEVAARVAAQVEDERFHALGL